MKTWVLTLIAVTALPLVATPAAAADMSDHRRAPAPPPVYAPRVYVPTYCRVATERYFDGYGWRIRDIQVCR
ncbi:MAG: hypothetical protein J0G95_01930 [Rhizobiales bacterium]|nr:hypothetical protein [Hyphomicrobiales bacterium]